MTTMTDFRFSIFHANRHLLGSCVLLGFLPIQQSPLIDSMYINLPLIDFIYLQRSMAAAAEQKAHATERCCKCGTTKDIFSWNKHSDSDESLIDAIHRFFPDAGVRDKVLEFQFSGTLKNGCWTLVFIGCHSCITANLAGQLRF